MASRDVADDPVPSTSYRDASLIPIPPAPPAEELETISIHSDTTDDGDDDNGDDGSDLDLGGEFEQFFKKKYPSLQTFDPSTPISFVIFHPHSN